MGGFSGNLIYCRMEIDHGKLFVGGISWDTNEDRLRDYFQNFGDVIEAVIMRDRATGRARGFGFVVFADPAVAERVVQEKHIIDGRNVEAKKAVPRDGQNNITRNPRSNSVSPGPSNIRTKKIFVGGLPSTITESNFKKYFDQFGLITDVVVMYDHNTQRPRGFGFITYDTEDAVDRALYTTFHELKGKMVEVKRAVPKELSPGPNRSPLGSFSPGLSRVSSFANGYAQGGYASSPIGNYGVRVDGRVSPGAIPTFVSLYGKGMHGGPNLNSSYGLNANFNPNLGYVKESNPLYGGISGRPANNVPTGNFGGGSPFLSPARGGLWGTESLNFSANSGAFTGSIGSENSWIGPYESIGRLWGSSSNLSDGIVNGSKFSGGNSNSGSIDKRFPGSYQKNNAGIGVIGPPSSYAAPGGGYDGSLDLYENGLPYGDPNWGSSPSRVENSAPLIYGHGNANADVMTKSSAGYVGYGMATVK